MVTDHFRIESDERGFTITKSLAWAMIVGLVGSAYWFGTEMSQLRTTVASLQNNNTSFRDEVRREIVALDSRLRAVERSDAQLSQIVRNQTQLLERIDERFEGLDNRLDSWINVP